MGIKIKPIKVVIIRLLDSIQSVVMGTFEVDVIQMLCWCNFVYTRVELVWGGTISMHATKSMNVLR